MKISIKPAHLGDGINAWYGVRYEAEVPEGDHVSTLTGHARTEGKALRDIRKRVRRMQRAQRRLERIMR